MVNYFVWKEKDYYIVKYFSLRLGTTLDTVFSYDTYISWGIVTCCFLP